MAAGVDRPQSETDARTQPSGSRPCSASLDQGCVSLRSEGSAKSMNPLHRIEQEVLAQGREWTRLKKGQFLVLTTRRPGPNVLRAAKVNKTKNGPLYSAYLPVNTLFTDVVGRIASGPKSAQQAAAESRQRTAKVEAPSRVHLGYRTIPESNSRARPANL